MDTAQPATKPELDAFAAALSAKVHSLKLKQALLQPFLDTLIKALADPLDFSDVRRLSSTLATLSNEKQRAEKEKKAGGKKKQQKAQVRVSSSEFEVPTGGGTAAAYVANDYSEYDDFM